MGFFTPFSLAVNATTQLPPGDILRISVEVEMEVEIQLISNEILSGEDESITIWEHRRNGEKLLHDRKSPAEVVSEIMLLEANL